MYIYDNVVILSSMWYVLRFEHAHGLKRYGVYPTGGVIWWDGKLSLCDQRDVQVFMALDCNSPTARGFQVVTDERKPVLDAQQRRHNKLAIRV